MENQFTDKANKIFAKIKTVADKAAKLAEMLVEHGEALKKEGVNRKQFLAWMKENCPLGRVQQFFIVGNVFPAEEGKKRGGRKPDAELAAMAEQLLEYAVSEFGDKARSVLLASYKLSKSED